jgi:hypothetical protein
MKISFLILIFLLIFEPALRVENILKSRLADDNISTKLRLAYKFWQENRKKEAIDEIERQLKSDSSLISEAAIITGGNYHLIQVTDNIFSDRVGGFSPSGSMLIFERDTFMVRYDDGMFDWVESRNTGIVCFDFITGQEISPDIPYKNAYKPRFHSDTTFIYQAKPDCSNENSSSSDLMLYNLNTGTSTSCFPLNRNNYCLYGNSVVFYDNYEGAIVMKDIFSKEQKVVYDNYGFLNYRRPLASIQYFSSGENVIMFQAGFGKSRVSIYSLTPDSGELQIRSNQQITWNTEARYSPAAVNEHEFVYLLDSQYGADVYYHVDETDYRVTCDGGNKRYLIISPSGTKIAFSRKHFDQNIDSYEIFILDFEQDTTPNDLKYRFMSIR